MPSSRFEVELTKQKNYQQAFDLACASLKGMDPEERARKAGGVYQQEEDGGKIVVDFFSEPYQIHFPRMEFDSPREKTISLVTWVLALTTSSGQMAALAEMDRIQRDTGRLLYAGVFEEG
jgi:hypothetical protein